MTDKPIAKLLVSYVDGRQEEVIITSTQFMVGRGEGAKFEVADNTISREHCLILQSEGSFQLIDLQSSNGTYLNDLRLHPNAPVRLKDGDWITVGMNAAQMQFFSVGEFFIDEDDLDDEVTGIFLPHRPGQHEPGNSTTAADWLDSLGRRKRKKDDDDEDDVTEVF